MGVRCAHRRSRRPRVRREGHALRDEHEPQQHAARHPRASDLGADGPHAEDRRRSARVLREGARARAQREEPVAAGSQPGRLERHSRSRRAEGAALPHPGYGRRRRRRHVQDHDRGIQRRPDLRRRRRTPLQPGRSADWHRAGSLAAEGRQRRRHHRSPDRDQRGLQHPPGVRRARHLGPDDGTRWPNLLGGRGHRPRRHGQERQALVLSEPGRGDALRARRLEFRSLRHRHPEPPGVLVRRVRQPDQRRQRRRSPGRDRARRLHPERLRQRMAVELAVRQVHRREEQPLQRLDGREHVQAALRGPGGAHHSAGGGVSRRSVGHGLQPGHRAHRRVAELLLRVEFSRRGRRCAHLRVQAEGGRRRASPSKTTRSCCAAS